MKTLTLLGLSVGALAMGASIYTAMETGQKSPIALSGSISLAQDLEADAKNIRTLFIIVFDPDSPMPRPFGAVREILKEDAKAGPFFDFLITKENIQMMDPNAPWPERLRLKVRLDQDGQAGPDQSGDLVGQLPAMAFGSRDLSVLIDQKIQ